MFASLATVIVLAFAPFTPTQAPPPPHLSSAPLEIGEITVTQIVDYTRAVELQEAVDYVAVVQAQEAAEAARAAQEASQAQSRVAPARPTTSSSPALASGACGGATNGADQYIQRESGGNPQVFNPSGAYGCYQIMPGTWAGAGCDQFGAYGAASPAAQAACASRLPMSAWAL